MRRARRGIRGKLLALLGLSFLVALAASLFVSLGILSRQAEREAARGLAAGQRTLGRVLELRQRLALGHALALAERDDVRAALASRRRDEMLDLARRALQEFNLDLVLFTDVAGTVLARGHAPAAHGDDGSRMATIASALRGRPLATIRRAPHVLLATSAGAPVVDSRPPYGLLGTVVAGLALDQRFVEDAHRDLGLDLSLVLDGRRVATSLPAVAPPPAVAGGPPSGPVRLAVDGVTYRASYAPLQGLDGSAPGGLVEVAASEGEAAALQRQTVLALTVVLTAVALGGLLVAGALADRLTAPLRRLAAAAEALGGGEGARPVAVETADEVGEVAAAFNRMADRIAGTHASLAASEARYRDLVDNAPVPFLILAPDGTVQGANRAAAGLLGHDDPRALEGLPALDLCPPTPAGRERAVAILERFQAGEAVRDEELEIVRRDGSHGWASVTLNAIRDPGGAVVGARAVAVDVSEARRARDVAAALSGVAHALASTLDVAAVRRLIVRTAAELLAVEYAVIWAPDEGSDRLVRVAAHATVGDVEDWQLPLPVGAGAGLLGVAMRERDVVVTTDVLADSRVRLPPALRARLEGSPLRAAMAVPFLVGGRFMGALFVRTRTGHRFSGEQIALARALADHAALSLENARLFEDSRRREREAVALGDLGRRIGESLELDRLLPRVAATAQALTDADGAFVGLRERPGDPHVTIRYDTGAAAEAGRGVAIHPGEGLGGRVLETGRPARTDDYARDHAGSAPRLAAIARRMGVTAMMIVPVLADQRVVGLLYAFRRAPRPFTDGDEATLGRLASVAGPAIANAMLYLEARDARQRLAALSAELLRLQETERRQLARELHDELGQALTALNINLGLLATGPAGSDPRLLESAALAERLLRQVRDLALALRPAILDDLGLDAAVPWLVRAQAGRAGLEATIDVAVGDPRPPADVETACFRVIQESVTNALRHARARRLTVQVRREGRALRLLVQDDGVGFDLAAAREHVRGGASLGLLGIEERTRLLGGRVEIDSRPGAGTSVVAWLPLDGPGAGAAPASAAPAMLPGSARSPS